MAVALILTGLFLALLPGLLRPLGRRIAPAEWTQLTFVALIGSVAVVEAGLVLLAAPTVFRALGIGALADACDRLAGSLMPLGSTGGWIATTAAIVTPVSGAVGWFISRRRVGGLAIEPYLGTHERRSDHELVIIPTDSHIAYCIDAADPQVVVSQGLIDALTEAEFDAVIAHELAHLSHDHPRMLLIAASAGSALGWWPPMRPSVRAFRASIERWADDHAAGADPARRRSVCDALQRIGAVATPKPVAAFSLSDATAERIEAMRSVQVAPWTVHAAIYLPGALAGVVALAAVGVWLSQTEAVLAMAGRCPI